MNPSPLSQIRKKCVECSGNGLTEIKACPVLDCPLWKFRLGLHPYTQKNFKNPFLQRENFVGLENKPAVEVIKIIGGRQNDRGKNQNNSE